MRVVSSFYILVCSNSCGAASAIETRFNRNLEIPVPTDNTAVPHHERIEDPLFRRAVDFIDAGDADGLAQLLSENPGLILQRVTFEGDTYFHNPSLLEFIAENPIRRGTLPANIIDIARAILRAGPEPRAMNDTLGLVASGRVARECNSQLPLIDLLYESGADPNSALQAAAVHGEFAAVNELIRLGATPDLPILAALGSATEFTARLPSSTPAQRQLALAFAAQYGHAEIVRALLDAGEDPNRYNPRGAHSHSTPLHQAALAGHLDVVKLLVEHGAKIDAQDLLWKGTPAGWARHGNQAEVELYLKEFARAHPNKARG
jgi:ankyrin repeat protein